MTYAILDLGNWRGTAAVMLASRRPERRWQVWVSARLGRERRVDAACACGYRLQINAGSNPHAARRTARMKTEQEPSHQGSRVDPFRPSPFRPSALPPFRNAVAMALRRFESKMENDSELRTKMHDLEWKLINVKM